MNLYSYSNEASNQFGLLRLSTINLSNVDDAYAVLLPKRHRNNIAAFQKYFFIILLSLLQTSFAQLPIKWSNIAEGSESDAQFLIPSTANNTFVLNRKSGFFFRKDKWFIDVFNDSTLQKTYSEEFFLKQKAEHYQETFSLKNKSFIFTNSYKNNVKRLLAYEVQANGMALCKDTSLTEIAEVENRNDFNFHIYQSNDSSKLCVFSFVPNNGSDNKPLQIDLFDNSLKKIASQRVLLPYQNREIYFLDAAICQNKAAFLIKVADDEKLHVFSLKSYSYYIVSCNIGLSTFNVSQLSLNKKSTIIGSSFLVDHNNEFVLCGFHKFITNKNDAVVKPFIHKILDNNYNPQTTDYTDDYAQPNVSLNIIKDNYPYNYQPLLSYVLPDGKVMLVSEKFFVETSCITDYRSGIQRCNYYYHNDNIEGFVFDDTYDARKKFAIEKKQISINDDGYFLGAAFGLINKNLVFIYNDSKKNALVKQPKINSNDEVHYMNSSKKSNVIMANVDANGNVFKQILFSNSGNKTVFVAQKSMIYSNGKIVLYCKRSNKYNIGIAHF